MNRGTIVLNGVCYTGGGSDFDESKIIKDYSGLTGKPKINGVELTGNKSFSDLNLYTKVRGTLAVGATTITLSNSKITTSSTLTFYTSIYGIAPTSVVVNNGSVVLTFDAQTTAMTVEVRVEN